MACHQPRPRVLLFYVVLSEGMIHCGENELKERFVKMENVYDIWFRKFVFSCGLKSFILFQGREDELVSRFISCFCERAIGFTRCFCEQAIGFIRCCDERTNTVDSSQESLPMEAPKVNTFH